ncbi:MAG: EAL domain-containing protein [Pseudomonadota bacterium]
MASVAKKGMHLNKMLDVLASRAGLLSVAALLFGMSLATALYLQNVVDQIDADQAHFKDAQIRNGYVAISDINRLVFVAQNAAQSDEMTPELAADFANAADILWVRTDNFATVRDRGAYYASGDESIAALSWIVDIADQALAEGFPDRRKLVTDLLDAGEVARVNLVMFLDELRRAGDLVLDQQLSIVRKQQLLMLFALTGLTSIGIIALSLLRREVLGRRAREEAEQRVEFLAFFDPLTELPNRVQFQDRLDEMLTSRSSTALLFIDLDEFKIVNDTYGHAAGDLVLQRIASIISGHAAPHRGVASRLSGDEFALALPIGDLDKLLGICEAILSEVRMPLEYEDQRLELSVSIGLAVSSQLQIEEVTTGEGLSRVTDFALYASKRNGRNRVTVYDHALEAQFRERRAMLDELPEAILSGKIEAYLQPKVYLEDGSTFGFEALARWPRDGRVVSPVEFISLAEESGQVVDIDRHILRRATQVIQDWNELHGTDFSVSVNLSAINLGSRRIVEWVEQALWASELPPRNLTLEITETTELREWGPASEIIRDLRNLGCKIAIDDFGSGYSSLAYLLSMQADELKIDKSLMDKVETSQEARMLLASVTEIARNLDLNVTAEGIETQQQNLIARQIGVAQGQGYLFGKPLPPADALGATLTDELAMESVAIKSAAR